MSVRRQVLAALRRARFRLRRSGLFEALLAVGVKAKYRELPQLCSARARVADGAPEPLRTYHVRAWGLLRRIGGEKCHNSGVSAPYMDKMEYFVEVHPDKLLGRLTMGLAAEGFDTNPATTFSWKSEITQLQKALRELLELLPAASQWSVLLEYVLPGIGQRVDCVLLASDVIYVIEYKGGDTATALAALKQAQEYALNLVDFHEASRHRTAIPIALGRFKSFIHLDVSSKHQCAAVSPEILSATILRSF